MKKASWLLTSVLLFIFNTNYAQSFSGDLQLESDFYQRDSAIGAANSPLYDNLLSSTTAWLSLNASYKGFDVGLRFDVYDNSPEFNPLVPYTGQGIGTWYISKQIDKLKVTVGYFYEQYGSGIVFRAYEDRSLGIDYAVAGIKLEYQLSPKWSIRAFSGRQKNIFTEYNPILKGADIEGTINVGNNLQLLPGAAFLDRTIDQGSMNLIVSTINSYDSAQRFVPKYNVYAFSGYNTLNFKSLSWYIEYAYKTQEAIVGSSNTLINVPGNVAYSSLSISQSGFGATFQFKRTDDFVLRTSPNETLLNGVLDYLPSLTRQNSLRLLVLYPAQTQYLGELAFEGDASYSIKHDVTFTANYSNIQDLNDNPLYQEIYFDVDIKKYTKTETVIGVQNVFYNQNVYQNEPGTPDVYATTPFVDFTYKFTQFKSLKFDAEYSYSQTGYGQFAYALVEYDIAPTWSFAASDMYNVVPYPVTTPKEHYYNLYIYYTRKANQFSLGYVRQIAGINCTGGVCRYEPAFSGIKFGITTTF